MASSPFLSPEELDAEKLKAAEGETNRFRELVKTALMEQNPGVSAYSVSTAGYREVAITQVVRELRDAGWIVRPGSQHDGPEMLFIDRPRPGYSQLDR